MNAIKDYFLLAGQIFLGFVIVGCVIAAFAGSILLIEWVGSEIHPIGGAVVAAALLSLAFAAFAIGERD